MILRYARKASVAVLSATLHTTAALLGAISAYFILPPLALLLSPLIVLVSIRMGLRAQSDGLLVSGLQTALLLVLQPIVIPLLWYGNSITPIFFNLISSPFVGAVRGWESETYLEIFESFYNGCRDRLNSVKETYYFLRGFCQAIFQGQHELTLAHNWALSLLLMGILERFSWDMFYIDPDFNLHPTINISRANLRRAFQIDANGNPFDYANVQQGVNPPDITFESYQCTEEEMNIIRSNQQPPLSRKERKLLKALQKCQLPESTNAEKTVGDLRRNYQHLNYRLAKEDCPIMAVRPENESTILVVKQYYKDGQWLSVPKQSIIFDREAMRTWYNSNPVNPTHINRELFANPPRYKGYRTQYRFHSYDPSQENTNHSQELNELLLDIRNSLAIVLEPSNTPNNSSNQDNQNQNGTGIFSFAQSLISTMFASSANTTTTPVTLNNNIVQGSFLNAI